MGNNLPKTDWMLLNPQSETKNWLFRELTKVIMWFFLIVKIITYLR